MLKINFNDVMNKNKNEIIKILNDFDNLEWKEKMINKSTLSLYSQYKLNIEEESWYRNGFKYSIMMKVRSNSLKLNWRNWGFEQQKICSLCNEGIETLEHFIILCHKLQSSRNKYIELQKPIKEDNRKTIASVILLDENREQSNEYYINMIYHLWLIRDINTTQYTTQWCLYHNIGKIQNYPLDSIFLYQKLTS